MPKKEAISFPVAVGAAVRLEKGRNRYDRTSEARVGARGVVRKLDALDRCALVQWNQNFPTENLNEAALYPEWVSVHLLTQIEG